MNYLFLLLFLKKDKKTNLSLPWKKKSIFTTYVLKKRNNHLTQYLLLKQDLMCASPVAVNSIANFAWSLTTFAVEYATLPSSSTPRNWKGASPCVALRATYVGKFLICAIFHSFLFLSLIQIAFHFYESKLNCCALYVLLMVIIPLLFIHQSPATPK